MRNLRAIGSMTNHPKILHVSGSSMALSLQLLDQLEALKASGYHVAVVSSADNVECLDTLRARDIRHVAVKVNRRITPVADCGTLYDLYRVFRSESPDIVHTHTPKAAFLGQLAARLAGVPLVVNTVHGYYFHDRMPPLPQKFYRALERVAARCADLILFQSREDLRTAVRDGIGAAHKLTYLGNGIDVARFDRNRLDKTLLQRRRAELGLRPEHRVIGFVGRLTREKGIDELLQAVSLLVADVPNLRLLLVGPDDGYGEAISNAIAVARIQDRCILTGLRSDVEYLYPLMDVFVLPSHREGVPRALIEASAAGVPSVATNIRGCREIIQDGVSGFLVPVGDVVEIANRVRTLLTDQPLARDFAMTASRIAHNQFQAERVLSILLTHYGNLLSSRQPN
jgi:glycosyltransferase involved in cell wall biosynthesis